MEEDVKVLLNDLAEIVSAQESPEEKNEFIKDSLGRVHYRTPHTGPVVMFSGHTNIRNLLRTSCKNKEKKGQECSNANSSWWPRLVHDLHA